MRFHVLGLSHAKTTKEYCCDAFSQKVRLICKLLTGLGHEVFHYGTEGSDPVCTENVNVLSQETFEKVHGVYSWRQEGFKIDPSCLANQEFDRNAIQEINRRKQPGDFLLCSFGVQHKPIADAVQLITVELGIGYENTFAPFRVFESYAWMHYIYGREHKKLNPSLYDVVIPNYYDLDDYIVSEEKDNYFFFIARPTPLKGLEIAIRVADELDTKLLVAGQGTPFMTGKTMEFLGVVSIEERAKYMSRAKATFVPTLYIEPFGGTTVESLLCGTPIITTDFGAFPEICIHGKTGYRCRTLEQFIWAAKNISNIDPKECRKFAEENYNLKRVAQMYQEYFEMLQALHNKNTKGWYSKESVRSDMNWLKKVY
jgi:glycosyltransferase involved in cell wall biosynthesis